MDIRYKSFESVTAVTVTRDASLPFLPVAVWELEGERPRNSFYYWTRF